MPTIGDLNGRSLHPESAVWTTFSQKRHVRADRYTRAAAWHRPRDWRASRRVRWYIRPYSCGPCSVARNFSVLLHPGAEHYYREKGYVPW